MEKSGSIGVFDSGIGGLSVWKELRLVLPNESTLYISDSAHAPYGTKTRKYIQDRSRSLTRHLIEQGCKIIVVACNTATGAAISKLRQEFDVPFIGVEPAIKPAALASKSGHIGVLATVQTFKGEHFRRTSGLYADKVRVHVQAGTGLVELIESGRLDSEETLNLLHSFLDPMVEAGVDQLVLGCTHYPFLIPVIRAFIPKTVTVIDPAPAVARQTKRVLEHHGILLKQKAESRHVFLTTGDPVPMQRFMESMGWDYPVHTIHTI
jgi:glutamate racemase